MILETEWLNTTITSASRSWLFVQGRGAGVLRYVGRRTRQ